MRQLEQRLVVVVLFFGVSPGSTSCTREATSGTDAGLVLRPAPPMKPQKSVLSRSADGAVSMSWRVGDTTYLDLNNDGRPDVITTGSAALRIEETDSQAGARGFLDRRQELHFEQGRVLEIQYERDGPDAGWREVSTNETSSTME